MGDVGECDVVSTSLFAQSCYGMWGFWLPQKLVQPTVWPSRKFQFQFLAFLEVFASAFSAGGIFSSFDGGKRDSFEKRRRALAATTAVAVTLKNKKKSQRPWLFFAWKFNYFKYFSSCFHSIHACFWNNIFHFVFIKYTAFWINWRVQWSLNKTLRKSPFN